MASILGLLEARKAVARAAAVLEAAEIKLDRRVIAREDLERQLLQAQESLYERVVDRAPSGARRSIVGSSGWHKSAAQPWEPNGRWQSIPDLRIATRRPQVPD